MRAFVAAAAVAALLAGSAAQAAKPAPQPLPPPADQALARDMLAELISINTVHPQGTRKAVDAILARLKAAGFQDSDYQILAPKGQEAWANLVVRLKGKGKARPILYEGHLDVVEAKPEDWTLPPFQLTEKDGYFYGRGVIDMKGDDIAILMSIIRMKREGFVPDRDIILAFTADEESGDANGVDFLMKQHREAVDAEYAVNVDAGGGAYLQGQRIGYTVQTSEKTYVTYQLEVTNPGGHSSRPPKENAIYRLAAALGRLDASLDLPFKTTATTRAMFAAQAGREEGQRKADFLAVAQDAPDPAAAARLGQDPFWNAMLRTTCTPTLLAGGHAENALPQRATAAIQCRMMPGDTEAQTLAAIVKAVDDPQVAVTVINPAQNSAESPPTPALMKTVQGVVSGLWPGVAVSPVMETGATDGLYSRAAGIPTYGLSGMFSDIEDNRAHGRDERILVSAFYEDVEFAYRLMKALSKA
jgi:acetylornithine deacetylase/succinyl-diaminopimelate desuccinylase-like protein